MTVFAVKNKKKAVVGVYQKFANAVRKQTLLRSFTVRLRECRNRGRSFTFVYYFGKGPPPDSAGRRRHARQEDGGFSSWEVYKYRKQFLYGPKSRV